MSSWTPRAPTPPPPLHPLSHLLTHTHTLSLRSLTFNHFHSHPLTHTYSLTGLNLANLQPLSLSLSLTQLTHTWSYALNLHSPTNAHSRSLYAPFTCLLSLAQLLLTDFRKLLLLLTSLVHVCCRSLNLHSLGLDCATGRSALDWFVRSGRLRAAGSFRGKRRTLGAGDGFRNRLYF